MRFHFKRFLKDENTGKPPTNGQKLAPVSTSNFSRDNTKCKRSKSYHFAPKTPQNVVVNKQISTDSAYSATTNTGSGESSPENSRSSPICSENDSKTVKTVKRSNSVNNKTVKNSLNSSASSSRKISRSNSSRETTSVSRSNSDCGSLMQC